MFKVPCVTFTHGEQAISHYKLTLAKKCCRKGIPLVITDINMPGIDGFEVAKQILQLDSTAEGVRHKVIVLALTAHVTDKVEMNGIKVGIQKVLAKPLEYPTFKEVIQKCFYPYA